jgi:vacuolar-type H+-ATPase subunit I/STV1
MMLTTRMVQLFAVVLRKDCDRVTEALLREGLMQFMDTAEVRGEPTGSFPAVRPEESLADVSELRQRIEGLLYAGGARPPAPGEADLNRRAEVDVDAEKKSLDVIDARRAGIRERQRAIQQEILKLEGIKRQVGLYGIGVPDAALSTRHPFLVVQTGKVPQSSLGRLEDGLKDVAALNLELGREGGEVHCLLISMKRDREQVGKILAGAAWSEIELPRELKSVKEDAFKELSAQINGLTAEQKKLEAEADAVVKEAEGRLREVWINLRVS